MILTLHYLGKGGALQTTGIAFYFTWFLEISCMIAVNVYVLISGYFLTKGCLAGRRYLSFVRERDSIQ